MENPWKGWERKRNLTLFVNPIQSIPGVILLQFGKSKGFHYTEEPQIYSFKRDKIVYNYNKIVTINTTFRTVTIVLLKSFQLSGACTRPNYRNFHRGRPSS